MSNDEQVPQYIQEKLADEFGTPPEVLKRSNGPQGTGRSRHKRNPLNRVTVVERVHHQVVGDDTTSVVASYSRYLKTDEPAYKSRVLQIGEEWQTIPTGDINKGNVSVFIIQNVTGQQLQVIPSQEEQERIDNAIIEVGKRVILPDDQIDVITDIAHILPGEHVHMDPSASVEMYFMRCLSGVADYKIHVIPK